jgi:hypothetical protein
MMFSSRRAYSLLEMVVALSGAAVLTVGLASAIAVSARSYTEVGRGRAVAEVADAHAAMLGELSQATGIVSADSDHVTFTVADRDGDGVEETLSYRLTGTGGSLLFSFNAFPPEPLLKEVAEFGVEMAERAIEGQFDAPGAADPQRWGERWREGWVLGYDQVFSGGYVENRRQIATKAELTRPGKVVSISVYLPGPRGSVTCALYHADGKGDAPGTLIATADVQKLTKTGWTTMPIGPVVLAPGHYYLAACYDDDKLALASDSSTGTTHVIHNDAFLRGWANPWSSKTSAKAFRFSIYATYESP